MYFNEYKLIDFKEIIEDYDNIVAHRDGAKLKLETLLEHSNLSLDYFFSICRIKNLSVIFENFENTFLKDCSKECISIWKDIIVNTVFLHDLGKINPYFQWKKMKNKKYVRYRTGKSEHAVYSSYGFYRCIYEELNTVSSEEKYILLEMLSISMYVIDRHHSHLKDFNKSIEDVDFVIEDYDSTIFKNFKKEVYDNKSKLLNMFGRVKEKICSKNDNIGIDLYIYSKFLYSILVTSDYYATAEYMTGNKIEDFGVIDNIEEYEACYKDNDIYRGIEKYAKDKKEDENKDLDLNNLNILRNEMFLESESNLMKSLDNDIFFLPAPTGAGKTNMSVNLAINLIKGNENLNNVFYTFPFNNLVEQTRESLVRTFSKNENISENIVVVNSVTAFKEFKKDGENIGTFDGSSNDEETGDIDFDKTYLSNQFLHYPVTINTHVGLFNILFGINKSQSFPLVRLCNSVVILDEIQAYKNSIWKEIIIFLKAYARLLNIKIIIMSATLPALDTLGFEKKGFTRLIEEPMKYFKSKAFKGRVSIDYTLLDVDKEDILATLIQSFIENIKKREEEGNKTKIIIEFIAKKSAKDFYNLLVEKSSLFKEVEMVLFTGDDNLAERKRIVERIKTTNSNMILVTTQVVEAGVDIDMDIGYKDISLLDSEEQFLGRINRNNKKKGSVAYFFDYDDAKKVYRGDIRAMSKYSLTNTNIRDVLNSKNFNSYYVDVLKNVDKLTAKNNKDNIERFIDNNINRDMKYKEVKERLKLIEDKPSITLFVESEMVINGEIYNGEKVWKDYLDILRNVDLEISERKTLLSKQNEIVQNFTYEIRENLRGTFCYDMDLSFGDIFYIPFNDKYFNNGKFDIDKFLNDSFS